MKKLLWHAGNGEGPRAMPDSDCAIASAPTLTVIGNFDGVHRGHTELLALSAHFPELPLVVLTFDPHPVSVLSTKPAQILTRLDRKLELLFAHGVECVAVQPFDREFASLDAHDFASELIVRRLRARVVIVGENFRFGTHRSGDFNLLQKLGEKLGFLTKSAPLLQDDGAPVSSSRIRRTLEIGDVETAARLLGRPHRIRGTVARGDQIGRTIGFPTANLAEYAEMLPANGVYVVRTHIADQAFFGVMNIGMRPTVSSSTPSPRVEAHWLDLPENIADLYDQSLDIDLLVRLRDERKFASLDELKLQIARDIGNARQWLQNNSFGAPIA